MDLPSGWKPDHDEVLQNTLQNIAECAKRPYYDNLRGFRFSPKSLPADVFVWVKYGHESDSLRAEANTQYYVHEQLSKMDEGARQRFHVPRVFDFIDTELDVKLHSFDESQLLPYGIIVMEYITGTSVAQISSDIRPDPLIAKTTRMNKESQNLPHYLLKSNLQTRAAKTQPEQRDRLNWLLQRRTMRARHMYKRRRGFLQSPPQEQQAEQSSGKPELSAEEIAEKEAPFKNRVADAISFLLSLPPPSGVTPGPVGGGLIKNWAFGKDDSDAPREFANLEELNEFVNKKIVEERSDMFQANLVPEGLKLCYCDLNLHNFIMEDRENPDSRIIIIDFEHANFLPHSFLTWEMWNKREFDMEERVRLQSNLTLSRDNVYAIHELCRVVTRQWNVTGYKD
ncbi:hypothetical protein CGLO_05702 [Colletotrichum gloeosporioides Cg-14]|uniref:Aminoglycoside phosphotransferase domain-containing protein n=1 Tax=Colletotrichum gloeosporioides (strain Cg-14) TaxID=1237896 RepID=T0M130_COLGC|nr:hypothetical protein CGLO_05702 [Colletotrichum gloeosporioides Cg-14]